MTKVLLNISFLLIFVNCLNSQIFNTVAEININQEYLTSNYNDFSTDFFLSNKKEICKYYCYDFLDIIKGNLKDKHLNNNNIVVIAESSNGKRILCDLYDIKSNMTPLLLYSKQTKAVGDTVIVSDSKNFKGIIDTKLLNNEYKHSVIRKYYLPIKQLSSNEKNDFFQPYTLVFPYDDNTSRWLTNVNKIIIVELK